MAKIRIALYIAAALAFLSFWTAGFAADSTPLYVVASIVLFVSSLVCWIGGVYIWTVVHQQGRSNLFSLVVLVLFGFLIGWLYVLIRASELDHRAQAPAT